MQGDFSRDTFHRLQHFSRVLRQQGRVELDADTNEQTSILLHLIRSLARDVYGDSWGRKGFEITVDPPDKKGLTQLRIGAGRFYVDGILCENDPLADCGTEAPEWTDYITQPEKPVLPTAEESFLVYLEVWEQHVNSIEEPVIREVALGGPDTASRGKVMWRVRTVEGDFSAIDNYEKAIDPKSAWMNFLQDKRPTNRGCLTATLTKPRGGDPTPCPTSPTSRYRGAENQLYRIQVRRGGSIGDDPAPTFIWSRDNGCLVYAIRKLERDTGKNRARVSLDSLGRDSGQSLETNQWVELVVGDVGPSRLFRVANVYPDDLSVDLDGAGDVSEIDKANTGAYLRRWDHRPDSNETHEGAVPVEEGKEIEIENGIKIVFQESNKEATYLPGDYWLIPARTATGTIEWPQKANSDEPLPQPPRGEEHHFAPLAVVDPTKTTPDDRVKKLRRSLS